MFRSPMRSSSGISLFTSFNISNINKEVNKEILEDDLIGDRNMLDYFLKVF